MSKDPKEPGNTASGYGKPPVEHQFAKGISGNPRGRPAKRERSLLPRQLRRDVLAIAEAPVRVRTPDGERLVTMLEATVMSLGKRGVAGHYASAKFFYELSQTALEEHYKAHADFQLLEHLEKDAVLNKPMSASGRRTLNKLRKATRKT